MSYRTLGTLLLLAGCGSQSSDAGSNTPPIGESRASQVRADGEESRPGVVAQRPPPEPELGPVRVRYDFAGWVARAEVRQGRTLTIDFGVPGGAKYTLGGWTSGTGADRELDGTSVLVIGDARAKLALPVDFDGPGVLTIRAATFARGPTAVYVGDATIAQAQFAGDGTFRVVRIPIPAEQLGRGEKLLQLRPAGAGSARGIGSARIAIDWIRFGPADEGQAADETAPPAPDALGVREGDVPVLALPSGYALGWTAAIPEDASVRGLAKGEGGRLEVIATRDGADPQVLGDVRPTREGTRFDFSLRALAGQVARIDLRATGGAVRVLRPALVVPGEAPRVQARPVRNAIIYLVDTLRADKLRPYNPSTRVRTPGLDRFVESAITLTQGHTQENWTKPSVATLLSSLMPWEHGAYTEEGIVPPQVELLPEILERRGFHSGAFIANGYASDRFGFRQGWDTWRNYIREGRRTPAQYVAADVLEWLDRRPQDQPFFLYIHTIDPHVPYRPPSEFTAMYDPNPYSGIVDFSRDITLLEKIKVGQIRLNERDKVRLQALYDGEITYHDVHFNAIIDGLERRGVADDTIVVLCADHGEEFWDHGSVGHGHNVYEELLHIPLIVRLPGAPALRVDEPAGLVDVMPTVLEALGQPVPANLSGRSLIPLLRGQDDGAPRVTVAGFMENWRTVQVGTRKLIHRANGRYTLYDLAADPGERTDLAAANPLTVRWLRGMLGLTLAQADVVGGSRAARPRVTVQQQTTEIDPATRAELEALGYVGGPH